MSATDRYDYILLKALWEGGVKRQELMDRFEIGPAQATKDFSKVKSLFPEAMRYSPADKQNIDVNCRKYLGSKTFDDYLKITGKYDFIQQLNNVHSDLPVELYRKIHTAITNKFGIQFQYHSINNPEKNSVRTVYPHNLINSGYRWHIRGWEQESGEFKDFNVMRMYGDIQLEKNKQPNASINNDVKWNTYKTVFLIPNPKLNPDQKDIISMDYGMKNGVLTVNCREALFLYTMHTFLITDFSESPNEHQYLSIAKKIS
ncbi:WYL domain-containing protein [Thiomicrorhabdus sp. 6S2-11]|uniref:WYL domain-containing protein n=1 Tax=Thiomicrorhabdus marina TaxID=2818442 RepID=A0ABS3Q5A7_9GAMM|nr:WYL domain-containing protein [Thiomicrorhabdus marina]MBO1927499.1 WYL domain-containing protein [Thiomicrorhabdus marina]